jgi:hypothetical protein
LLWLISAVQLSVGVAGQFVATREGRSFEIFRWHGDPKRVAQESWFMGTGLSAPVAMMAVHAAALAVLTARPSRRAAATLGALGATMAGGYLIENKFRSAIRHPAQEPFPTALGGVGFILAVAMAVIGAREARSATFARRTA